jgi:hypothetical protein
MSTIVVTDILPGTTADIADVNTTIASVNAATAAGSIGGDNVAVEGLDRRTMSSAGHVVYTQAAGTNTVNQTGTASAFVHSTGVYVIVPIGAGGVYGGELTTIDMTPSLTTRMLLTATLAFHSLWGLAGTARVRLTMALQISTNSGGAWTTIVGTTRRFQMRETGALADPWVDALAHVVPALANCCTWTVSAAPAATVRYRVVYQTADDTTAGGSDIVFDNGAIFVEPLAT